MNRVIRIGTRKSALAVAQAQLVADAMKAASPRLEFELVLKQTAGDRILDKPLLEFGGKGVFVSEFEQALLNKEIDFAVHSAKDLPMDLADGLAIVAVPEREDARDVLVTMAGNMLVGKTEVVIGTSSLRRGLQIKKLGGALWNGASIRVENLRGNVQTRLQKLASGTYDAIILAAAGLRRLRLDEDRNYEMHYFDCDQFIPAGGQGILAVEGRIGDPVNEAAMKIHNDRAGHCLTWERKVLHLLEAGCHEPVGVYTSIDGDCVKIEGICERDGCVRETHLKGTYDEAELLVLRTAKKLGKGGI